MKNVKYYETYEEMQRNVINWDCYNVTGVDMIKRIEKKLEALWKELKKRVDKYLGLWYNMGKVWYINVWKDDLYEWEVWRDSVFSNQEEAHEICNALNEKNENLEIEYEVYEFYLNPDTGGI